MSRVLLLTAAAAAMLAATPAAAIVKIAEYSGTIQSGLDVTGVFASAGSDLAGYGWVASFTYNRALGSVQYSDDIIDLSEGGSASGTPEVTPFLIATITINGVTRSATGTTYAIARTESTPFVWHFAGDEIDDAAIYQSNHINVQGNPADAPASLNQNFGPAAVSDFTGYMQWQNYDRATSSYVDLAYADLGTDAVYSVRDAVPEPVSWAMLITGFGLVGAAMRRRTRVAVPCSRSTG